jgi:hypothetical protein
VVLYLPNVYYVGFSTWAAKDKLSKNRKTFQLQLSILLALQSLIVIAGFLVVVYGVVAIPDKNFALWLIVPTVLGLITLAIFYYLQEITSPKR